MGNIGALNTSASSADARTELDSHANMMVVLGKHSFIFEATGQKCNVKPFTSDLGQLSNMPIVDGAIAYNCPHTGQVYVLLLWNALHMPAMEINLIPLCIMRVRGVNVSDVPKSQ